MYNVSLNNNEACGSLAYGKYNQNCPPENPNCNQVNFRGREDYYEKKDYTALKAVIGLAGVTALAIGGLGLAHKNNLISKIKNEKLKDFVSKAEPAAEKCYEWCGKVKKAGMQGIDWVKNIFKRKS